MKRDDGRHSRTMVIVERGVVCQQQQGMARPVFVQANDPSRHQQVAAGEFLKHFSQAAAAVHTRRR